jgi:hypothetical protein
MLKPEYEINKVFCVASASFSQNKIKSNQIKRKNPKKKCA